MVDARGRGERVASPGEQGVALGHDPVGCSVEVEDGEGRVWRLGGYEGGDGCRRRDALVEEGDAERGSSEGREEGEGGLRLSMGSASGKRMVRQRKGVCVDLHFRPCRRPTRAFPVLCRGAATQTGRRRGGSRATRALRSGHLDTVRKLCHCHGTVLPTCRVALRSRVSSKGVGGGPRVGGGGCADLDGATLPAHKARPCWRPCQRCCRPQPSGQGRLSSHGCAATGDVVVLMPELEAVPCFVPGLAKNPSPRIPCS